MITRSDILKAKILIVDDLQANVSLLEQMLTGAGYVSLASTRDPHAVCELHRQNRYDLMLLDLQMPGLDGFQVMHGLKEIEPGGDLPILVITAQPGHKLRALRAGAKDFISKPFDLTEVLVRVHNMIEVRLLHRNEVLLSSMRLENSQRIAGLGDWQYDLVDHRLLWSDGVYQILGIARKDFAPDSAVFYRQVHPDDIAFVHQQKKIAADGARRVDFEHRLIRSDGEVRYIHQITEMIRDDQGRPVRESGTLQDITERKLANAALLQSEERYRKMVMMSPDAHFVNVDGLIISVNQAFCELMRAGEPAQLLDLPWVEVVHPDYHELAYKRQQKIIENQPIPPSEMKFVRLDGTFVDVEVASMAFDFRGRKEVQVIARDITARRRAEEELREKTALLEAQIESSIDGMLIVDPQGKKILQNDRYIELMKIPREIASGQDSLLARQSALAAVRHPEKVMEKVLYLYAHPRETGRDEIELKDGTVLDRYSSPIVGKDGKNYGRIWGFRDTTVNKAAEVALRESEERFKFVARAVSDVVWDWNLSADTLWWNDGFLTTFGFVAGEIAPTIGSWNGRIHPEDRRRVVDGIHQAIQAGTESWSAEYRFQRKDGSYALVEDHGYILRDETGKGVRMVGGMRDLTEEKKLEAQYLRAQRMESIGTLAGGIAHDLNNVLAPIMMAIELLKVDPANDPQRRKMLDTIYLSCRRGADLVRQVLSFGRGVDVRRAGIRLQNLIKELEGIISETFPRNIRIVPDVPDDLWYVIGDTTQLHQVLLNLAVNARDAMPHGGILSLKAANVTIDAQYAGTSRAARNDIRQQLKPGPHVLMRVSDTGSGIPPEIRERIFEPFFTTKEVGKGTGLGLATVHAIVKNHAGSISVYSEVGNGTTFSVYLPADPAYGTPASTHPFTDNLPLGQNELVLVVDDEASIREITQQTLEAFGYRVLIARDGAEAVALYAKNAAEIALVLTDMMMPVMDGAATIHVLRSINPSVRIIAVSGLEVTTNAAKTVGAELCDFLPKPYTAQTLTLLVREVLDRPPRAPD